jgi:LPS-assembly lipoprotein
MTRALALLLTIAALPAVSACGLQPLYAGGASGVVASGLEQVDVAPIAGEAGWLVRAALQDRLSGSRGSTPNSQRYTVNIRLDDAIDGFGVRADDSVTRERRSLRARWQLVDSATGSTLIDASAGSDAGIDVVGSEYATIAAERTALEQLSETVADQITTRLALYFRRENNAVTAGSAADVIPPN